VKHKFLRWNEISRRYVRDSPEVYQPDKFRNAPVGSIKQGSSGEHYDSEDWKDIYADCMKGVVNLYNQMIKDGVAPEQARAVLPQGVLTEWHWSGSLDAFAQMCALRCKDDTQYESKVIAVQIADVMENLYPVSWTALMENL
jgi:thymidylate synthase (FAD)